MQLYTATVIDLDNAVRDARVLARKTSALLRHHEEVPADMALAVDALAGAIGIFADDLSEQDDFEEARGELVQAARMASLALPDRGDDEQRVHRRADPFAGRRPAVRERLHP